MNFKPNTKVPLMNLTAVKQISNDKIANDRQLKVLLDFFNYKRGCLGFEKEFNERFGSVVKITSLKEYHRALRWVMEYEGVDTVAMNKALLKIAELSSNITNNTES